MDLQFPHNFITNKLPLHFFSNFNITFYSIIIRIYLTIILLYATVITFYSIIIVILFNNYKINICLKNNTPILYFGRLFHIKVDYSGIIVFHSSIITVKDLLLFSRNKKIFWG